MTLEIPPIHVVFTKNTFDLLKLGAYSLHRHSGLPIRIVCNGLDSDEVDTVAEFCECFSRMDFLDFPSTGRMLPHGSLLQLLFLSSQAELFVFADSDVFALSPFQSDFDAVVNHADIASMALNPKQTGKHIVGTGGGSTLSPSGQPLAGTYFCAYRRSTVSKLMHETGVSIERYQRRTQIPGGIIEEIPSADLGKGNFDTGKLLALLASLRKLRVVHHPLPQIFHMGRMSVPARADHADLPAQMRRKRKLREFFGEFMVRLKSGMPVDSLEIDDPSLKPMLGQVCPRLVELQRCLEQDLAKYGHGRESD